MLKPAGMKACKQDEKWEQDCQTSTLLYCWHCKDTEEQDDQIIKKTSKRDLTKGTRPDGFKYNWR